MKFPRKTLWIFFCGVGAFLLLMGPNIQNFPPVSSDEIWSLSVSFKLAQEHILGSDLFTGIYHADTRYFFNLPVYHFLQAGVFWLAGPGIWQGRLIPLLSGVILFVAVTWAVKDWFGSRPALLTAGFLLFWRSNLIAVSPGIPLIAAARNGRYDLTAVTFTWLSLLVLTNLLTTKNWKTGFLAGFFAGLGTLTQFFGFFVVPIIGCLWLYQNRRTWYRQPATYGLACGFLIVILPYLIYIFLYYDDFVGQTFLLKAERVNFGSLSFYMQNLWTEPQRYASLVTARTPGPWLTLLAGAAYFYHYLPNAFPTAPESVIRLLKVSFPLILLQLIFIDQTKAPLYSLILVPHLCIQFALLSDKLLTRVFTNLEGQFPAWFQKGGVAFVLMLVFLEGGVAYAMDWQAAQTVSPYQTVGQQIASYIPPEAPVAGMARWWWAFYTRPFTNTGSQWLRWRLEPDSANFQTIFAEDQMEYVLITKNVREYIVYQPKALEIDYWHFIETCTQPVASWTDPTYQLIEIHKISWTLPNCEGATAK